MVTRDNTDFVLIQPGRTLIKFLLFVVLSGVLPAVSSANPDVYSVLPADTRILQYSLADFDGDAREELAVLYQTADETRLTLFREDSGRWSRWWDDNGAINRQDGNALRSLETVDTNGDGRAEMLAYYLTEKNTAMAARILALDDQDLANPVFNVILEDMTAPPGYPLLGTEGQAHSVTFMRMASEEGNGYRRVYCWDGERFEKCLEVEWEVP
ncbi:VCBS repeat-containing protein [bacterium]|nr:VCBS repeat-containing protein [bacterium]